MWCLIERNVGATENTTNRRSHEVPMHVVVFSHFHLSLHPHAFLDFSHYLVQFLLFPFPDELLALPPDIKCFSWLPPCTRHNRPYRNFQYFRNSRHPWSQPCGQNWFRFYVLGTAAGIFDFGVIGIVCFLFFFTLGIYLWPADFCWLPGNAEHVMQLRFVCIVESLPIDEIGLFTGLSSHLLRYLDTLRTG